MSKFRDKFKKLSENAIEAFILLIGVLAVADDINKGNMKPYIEADRKRRQKEKDESEN